MICATTAGTASCTRSLGILPVSILGVLVCVFMMVVSVNFVSSSITQKTEVGKTISILASSTGIELKDVLSKTDNMGIISNKIVFSVVFLYSMV